MPPHSRHFIPCDQEGALAWVRNFVSFVREHREALGLEASRVEEAASALAAYEGAYATAMDRTTRTMNDVLRKNELRRGVEHLCREMAWTLRLNAKLSDEQRLQAGLRPRHDGVRRPAARPVSAPVLSFVGAMHGQYTFRYHDLTTPNRRSKPEGVAFLELHVAVAPEAARDVEAGRFCAYVTRTPFSVRVEESRPNLLATFFGRWMSLRQERGPWSAPVTVPVVWVAAQAA